MQPLMNRLWCHSDGLSELSSVACGFAGLLDGRFVHAGIVKQYFPPVSSIASKRRALLNQAMPAKGKPPTSSSPQPQEWRGRRLTAELKGANLSPSELARLCESKRSEVGGLRKTQTVSRQDVKGWQTTGRVAKPWLRVFAEIFQTSIEFWLSENAPRGKTSALNKQEQDLLKYFGLLIPSQRAAFYKEIEAEAKKNERISKHVTPRLATTSRVIENQKRADPKKTTAPRWMPTAARVKPREDDGYESP